MREASWEGAERMWRGGERRGRGGGWGQGRGSGWNEEEEEENLRHRMSRISTSSEEGVGSRGQRGLDRERRVDPSFGQSCRRVPPNRPDRSSGVYYGTLVEQPSTVSVGLQAVNVQPVPVAENWKEQSRRNMEIKAKAKAKEEEKDSSLRHHNIPETTAPGQPHPRKKPRWGELKKKLCKDCGGTEEDIPRGQCWMCLRGGPITTTAPASSPSSPPPPTSPTPPLFPSQPSHALDSQQSQDPWANVIPKEVGHNVGAGGRGYAEVLEGLLDGAEMPKDPKQVRGELAAWLESAVEAAGEKGLGVTAVEAAWAKTHPNGPSWSQKLAAAELRFANVVSVVTTSQRLKLNPRDKTLRLKY